MQLVSMKQITQQFHHYKIGIVTVAKSNKSIPEIHRLY
jgi:hypothetical protein